MGIYETAVRAYRNAIHDLSIIADRLNLYANQNGKTFNRKVFLSQFDCILQYSLLELAISDADLDLNELDFLKDITEHADFINYINRKYDFDITWNTIWNSGESDIRDFLNNIRPAMDEMRSEFVLAFSFYDLVDTKVNCLANLMTDTTAIVVALVAADGFSSETEKQAFLNNSYLLDMFKEIDYLIKNVDKPSDSSSKGGSSSSGSLKSVYENKVKKN